MTGQEIRPWYEINEVDKIDSPALVIFADRVKENIDKAITMAGDAQRLRPHVKTHKSPDVSRLMLAAGVTKFKCATIAEADMLGAVGAPDVLLAYQPVGPKVARLLHLVKTYPATSFSCLVDNLSAAEEINHRARSENHILRIFIDLNVGMNRTGIAVGEEAIRLFAQVAALENLKPVGLHAYDGHIHHPDLAIRKKQSDEAYDAVLSVLQVLADNGYPDLTAVMGGSPTFPFHAEREDVECSPGTFVYWDAGYGQAYPEQPFEPAAVLICRIISSSGHGVFCTDLGHKSVAAENPPDRRVRFLNVADFTVMGQSEEHLVIKTTQSFKIGDVLYGIPMHVCPTCALYERAVVVENGTVTGEWKIMARDRRINV